MLMQRKISQFLASAAPVALSCAAGLMVATPALADTTVSTGTTSTLATSTAGNVTIAGTGTLTGPAGATTGQATVTIDSSNTVTVNGGGIVYAGTSTAAQNGAIGIQINPGVTTTIINTGAINVLENFTPQTISGNFVESNVSGVSGRYGIYGAAGGTINGTITNSAATTVGSSTYTGAITVDGENSAGIRIDSDLNGALVNEGNITVLGDNSYGIKLGNVTANSGASGNVTVGGVVTVTGSGAQGYVQSGNVAGVILIDGAISNNTAYADSQGTSLTLTQSELNSGNPASLGTQAVVEIDGNVAGGILINAPTTSTSSDTNRGSITAYGNNPALQIGGATNITIGANANTDNGSLNGSTNSGSFALGIDGAVSANNGTTAGIASYGVVIGGRGGNVTLTGGMEVYGTITATTNDTTAVGVLIQPGSNVSTLFNSGTIKAAASTGSQVKGNVIGVQDLSGTLTSLTNQGFINASGSPATTSTVAAIDLSHSSQSETLTQSYTATNLTNQTTDQQATGYNPLTATLYAGIVGDVYFGTGAANKMAIASGSVTGNTYFGEGSGNTVTAADVTRWVGNINVGDSTAGGSLTMGLSKYAQFNGNLNLFGSTGSLTVADNATFHGAITGGSNFDVAVNGGNFGASSVSTTTVRNLTVASGAALNVFIDNTTGTASKLIANSATFASGAKLTLAINAIPTVNSTAVYDVVQAGTLTGASTLTSTSINLPVLFTGAVTTDANNVYVSITHATAAQLGLTAAQTAAYTAILGDAKNNGASVNLLQNTLLNVYDTPTLKNRFNELLPNYSGGTFDIVSRATRLADKHFDDDTTLFSISDASAWIEPIVFRGTVKAGDTPGFKTSGGGLSAGVEKVTPVGNVGFQLAWLTGSATTQTYDPATLANATSQRVKAGEFQLGLFWRKSAGPLYVWAGGNLGRETYNGTRTFFGQYTTATQTAVNTTNFSYNAAGHWAGWSAAFNGGVSYTIPVGEHFTLRPRGVLEYDRLKENGYIETGDTPIALTVASRTSSQTTATGTLAAKWSSGPSSHEGRPFAVEVEAGRRNWISGNLGTTTATFATGDTFSLTAPHLPSAWVGNVSIMQGGLDYTWKIGTDVERGSDKGISYGVRASLSIAL